MYVGGARGMERRIVRPAAMPYRELMVRSLRSGGLNAHLVLDPLRLAASVPQAWRLLGRWRPDVLFTTGGYLGIPLVLAARARGVPSLVWEGNLVPGKATAAVGRWAEQVAVSFPPTAACFPGRAFVSGTPIRSFEGIDRVRARASLGVGPDERLLLAFGGSQAVARLTAALDGALERLLDDWHVLHIAGEGGLAHAQQVRDRLPTTVRDRYQPTAFLADGMAEALVAADLVLGRAGSSTCAEVTAIGVASILVPYPYAGAHQRENAAWLSDQGAARVVPDAELDADRLLRETAALRDEEVRAAIATAARSLGRPEAADRIAAVLLEMARPA
jgi:UDP-N-acetylglucosamine--N-acetylmuramyl-(pentapeptide) pyrophosphoryl-undecaprenol N-acetylglucosamine transferase